MSFELLKEGALIMLIGMGVVYLFITVMICFMQLSSKIMVFINKYFPEEIEENISTTKKKTTSDDVAIALAIACAVAEGVKVLSSFISSHSVIISASLLILAYIFIALEKIPKMTIALIGGALTIVLGLVSQTKAVNGIINPNYFINYIDFNVIFLLVSMMIIVSITTRSGIFNWVANELLKFTKGHPIKVLCALGLFTAITSAFLDNVTTVILIMPITFAIAKKLNIDPIPFLLTEIFHQI